MITIHARFLVTAALAAALGGCVSSGGGYPVQNATGQPIPHHALADEVFLDGTGPSARRLARAPATAVVERRYAEPQLAGAPTRAVVRTRPTAIERADAVSARPEAAIQCQAMRTSLFPINGGRRSVARTLASSGSWISAAAAELRLI
jgi:hypothetical protein